ncbi:uncharacterized protein [Amphiura filiformis]|uniref:uncharacterized protein n=1 Tax=Amphiura filiformis TaxID=82378 RepID=UPI003B210B48
MGNHPSKGKVAILTQRLHRPWDNVTCYPSECDCRALNESHHSAVDSGYDTVQCEDRTARRNVVKVAEGWKESNMFRKSKKNVVKRDNPDIQAILRKLTDIQKSCDDDKLAGKYVEKGNFTAGFFTRQGGTLKIGNQASLYIPPDALPETGVHLIYIYIDSAAASRGSLEGGNQWLTPVVECGPDGQQFRRNVMLSVLMLNNFCHDAHLSSTTAHCTYETTERKGAWRRLENNPSIRGRRVLFEVDHFTGFAASGSTDARGEGGEPPGESKESTLIAAAVFLETSGADQEGDIVRVRWCDFQHYESMLKEEGALHFLSDRNPTPSLQVEQSDKDVVFRLVKDNSEIPSGNGMQIENIKCSDIWKKHTGEVRFVVEYKITQDIFVEVYQDSNERILLTPFTNVTNTGRLESEVSFLETIFYNHLPHPGTGAIFFS